MHDESKTYRELIEEVSFLKQRIEELEKAGSNEKHTEEALRERVKELNCLYSITGFIENTDSIDELFQKTINQMPHGWYYPEHACARITLQNKEFKTANFDETRWKISADIIVYGKPLGVMEVCYLEKMPDRDEGPFIKEERNLINVIARRLGKAIERKQTEASLAESENKYRQIVDNAYEGVMIIDNNSNISFVNARMAEMLGSTIEDLTGRSYFSCICDEDIADHLAQMETGRTGRPGHHERRLCRNDGSTLWTINSVTPIVDEKGIFQGSLGMFTDITGLKLAEGRLKESENRYRTLIENSIDGICVVRDGRHIYVNRKYVDMFGYDSMEEITGMPLTFNVHPDDKKLVMNRYRRRQRGKPVPSKYEFKGITKKGETIFIEVSVVRIVYDNEELSLAYLRDITDRKLVEEERVYSAKLESALQMAGAVCHELNQPLQAISGYADILLMEHMEDEKAVKRLEIIIEQIRRTGDITKKLMGIKYYKTRDYVGTVKIMDINQTLEDNSQ